MLAPLMVITPFLWRSLRRSGFSGQGDALLLGPELGIPGLGIHIHAAQPGKHTFDLAADGLDLLPGTVDLILHSQVRKQAIEKISAKRVKSSRAICTSAWILTSASSVLNRHS